MELKIKVEYPVYITIKEEDFKFKTLKELEEYILDQADHILDNSTVIPEIVNTYIQDYIKGGQTHVSIENCFELITNKLQNKTEMNTENKAWNLRT